MLIWKKMMNDRADVLKSIFDSLREVDTIRNSELEKRSYKYMIERIRTNLKEEE